MASPKTNFPGLKVGRCEPELVKPAKPTPHEFKELSDIDDQPCLRFHQQVFQLYKHNPSVQGKDPANTIREALAKALVFYYPFAGRLKEGPEGKLVVNCRGEGAIFVEADADVTLLEHFGDPPCPPFLYSEEFLYNVPDSDGILDCPLLLLQVTRLRCGSFVVAWRWNHTICDGNGFVQFLNAVADMARGLDAPSILPVWQRQLLNARDPPRITFTHNEYDIGVSNSDATNFNPKFREMAHHCFLLGSMELSMLRRHVPFHLIPCTRFEMVTALLWKCCTLAFQVEPNEVVRMNMAVSARPTFNPPLPKGYYGNSYASPVCMTTAGELVERQIGHAIELIREAKTKVSEEYMRSVADMMVVKKRPSLVQFKNETGPPLSYTFNVSDLSRIGYERVDYGWGEAAYGGAARGWISDHPAVAAFYAPFKDKFGKDGIMMIVSLPKIVMEQFSISIQEFIKDGARSRL